jgi:hypothetical protein
MELQLDFGDYYLVDENDNTIATTDKIMLKVDGSIKKLSKENCDEVYGGDVEMVTWVDLAATPTDSRHPDAYLGTDTGTPKLDENGSIILKNI